MGFLGGGDSVSTVLELLGVEQFVSGQMRIAGGWTEAQRAQDAYSESASRMASRGSALIGLGAGIATSAIVMGKSLLDAAGNMQATRSGFATLLGSMDAAKSKIAELQKFAADTPFDFAESAKGAQRLLATGVAADKLVPTMRSVASAVAAAQGNTQDFMDVLRAVGQIKTKGTLQLDDVQQIAEKGIPVLEILQKQLGLTKDQIGNLGNQHIDSDKAIGALLKGFDERFGKSLEDAAGNYNNAKSNFGDALDQLKATAGESLLPMATEALTGMTALVNKANEFLQLHPDFAKFALTFLAVGGGVMVAAGAFKRLQGMAMLAAQAKKLLEGATKADILAEKEKTGVADAEGKALGGAGDAAEKTAEKLKGLAGVKQTITGAFGSLKALANRTITPGAPGGRLAPAFEAMGITPRTITQIPAFGRAGMPVSAGGMAMGAALGAGAAYGARDDMKALGASEGQADLYAGITGAVTMGVTAFFPPARAIVAAAELFRLGVDKFYNEPMEKKAAEGSLGPDAEAKIAEQAKNKDHRSEAATYNDLSVKAKASGDLASAGSFKITADSLTKQADKDDQDKAFADAKAKNDAADKAAKEKDMLENPEKYSGVDPNASPYTRDAQGIGTNGAFDAEGGQAPPFSMADRTRRAVGPAATGSMDFAANYGNAGSDPNDYYARLQTAASDTGGASGGSIDAPVEEMRNGETIVRLPRRQADQLNDRLQAHNRLSTQF